MKPCFIATKRFGPWNRNFWTDYVSWSGLTQLDELVSLDSILCPIVLQEIKSHYWPHIVNEDFMLSFFADLEFLLNELSSFQNINLLCVFRNPPEDLDVSCLLIPFEFLGYDLMDAMNSVSSLTNCGGFPKAFDNSELNCKGLIPTRKRAFEVRDALLLHYPNDPHANCNVWAIFRAVTPLPKNK